MMINGIFVDSYTESDTEYVWHFVVGDVFHQVVLLEEDDNLRAWSATVGDTRFRPVRWLRDRALTWNSLDENSPEAEDMVVTYVREVIAASQQA